MEPISPWWTILATACASWLSYRLGYRQATIAKRSLDLSVSKAEPKIGTSVKLDQRQINPPAFPPFCYMVATIYNEGELAARNVKGHCRLHSSTKSVKEHDIPFERDFLGSAPLLLESHRLDNGISGMSIDLNTSGQGLQFDVDIEFEYFGMSAHVPQRYSAKYRFDSKSRQMLKAG